ncbi:MAG: helix-turn-helix domain-containing protein [Oscillospiraceae bacterium]|nr:helix-turn-helix domain-containing protein [Oscillospiraceae bacterium]
MQEFNKRLKEIRNENSVTQRDIAEAMGISVRAYQHYETGTRFPDFPGLIFLADYFSCSLDWLVGRSEDKRTEEMLALRDDLVIDAIGLSETEPGNDSTD